MNEYITYTTVTGTERKPSSRFQSFLLKSPSLNRCKTFFSRRKNSNRVPYLDRSDSTTTVNSDSTIQTPPHSPNLGTDTMEDEDEEQVGWGDSMMIPHSTNGYSIFYLKMPNGKWLMRVRTADRKIIATYEVDGCMI
ncbi:hypothetical protein EC973_007358 [Apophysomyces ossiformis]|uniref:Uncharacterized protein n=1 Tax=Apophysomyces ossiformis TaxID=679940 RepID=A0A8H7BV66_9FUNG|nr:hypothetical protein EC973_007358 [Apophysomyces ossiformis]